MPRSPHSVASKLSKLKTPQHGLAFKGNRGACGIAGGLAEGAAPPEGHGWPAHLVHPATSSLHFCTGHTPSCCSLQSPTAKTACFALCVVCCDRPAVTTILPLLNVPRVCCIQSVVEMIVCVLHDVIKS